MWAQPIEKDNPQANHTTCKTKYSLRAAWASSQASAADLPPAFATLWAAEYTLTQHNENWIVEKRHHFSKPSKYQKKHGLGWTSIWIQEKSISSWGTQWILFAIPSSSTWSFLVGVFDLEVAASHFSVFPFWDFLVSFLTLLRPFLASEFLAFAFALPNRSFFACSFFLHYPGSLPVLQGHFREHKALREHFREHKALQGHCQWSSNPLFFPDH